MQSSVIKNIEYNTNSLITLLKSGLILSKKVLNKKNMEDYKWNEFTIDKYIFIFIYNK